MEEDKTNEEIIGEESEADAVADKEADEAELEGEVEESEE